jgi:hypothetical protein
VGRVICLGTGDPSNAERAQTSQAGRLTGEETDGVPKERKRRYKEDTLEFLVRRFGAPGEAAPARASEAG